MAPKPLNGFQWKLELAYATMLAYDHTCKFMWHSDNVSGLGEHVMMSHVSVS